MSTDLLLARFVVTKSWSAAFMYDEPVQLAADLRRRGMSQHDISRKARAGEIFRIRHGGYAGDRPSGAEDRHRQLIAATLPLIDPTSIISHTSAALLWGLPTWDHALERVNVIRARDFGGRINPAVHLHPMVLPPDEIAMVEGVAVTSLARTVADCARVLPYAYGVAIGDAALRLGMNPVDLAVVLRRKPRRVGNPKARQVAAFIDARSESPYESVSRVRLAEHGLPTPTLQFEIVDPTTGVVVARVDFAWEEERTVGEFDGKIKYGRLVAPGRTAGDTVFDKKIREDAVRDLGWSMVRWTSKDLPRFQPVAARLRRAFRRQ